MTKFLDTTPATGNDKKHYSYYLAAPATGSNNIVISLSGSATVFAVAADYSGASQTGIPDASTSGGTSSGSFTATLTIVAANSWMCLWGSGADVTYTAGTGGTMRDQSANSGVCSLEDSNGPLAAGSQSLTMNDATGTTGAYLSWSFAPSIGSAVLTEGTIGTDSVIKSVTRNLLEGAIGTDLFAGIFIWVQTMTEGLIGADSLIRSVTRNITEGVIGTDSVIRSIARAIAEGAIGADSIVRGFTVMLRETLIGTDTLRILLNGSATIWHHIQKSSAATWTKVTKSSAATWTKFTKSGQ